MKIESVNVPAGANDNAAPTLALEWYRVDAPTDDGTWGVRYMRSDRDQALYLASQLTGARVVHLTTHETIIAGAPESANPITDDPTLAAYRAGLLCGLETAAQYVDQYHGRDFGSEIRKIKAEVSAKAIRTELPEIG